MTLTLRALLIIVSVLATTGVIGRIRKAKMQIEDAVFWVLFSFLLILLAVVPRVLYFFTELLGRNCLECSPRRTSCSWSSSAFF